MAIEKVNEEINLEIAPDSAQEITTPMMEGDAMMLEDGSAIVNPVEDTSEQGAFNANLAELIPDDELESLAGGLIADYEYDKDARDDWLKTYTAKKENSQGLCPVCQILDIIPSSHFPLLYPVYCILYPLHTRHYTLFPLPFVPCIQHTLIPWYPVYCTLYTVPMYTVYCIMYTVYFVYLYNCTSFDVLPRTWVPGGRSRVAWPPSPGLLGRLPGGGSGPKSETQSLSSPLGFRIVFYIAIDIDFCSSWGRFGLRIGGQFLSFWCLGRPKLVLEPSSNRLTFEKVIDHETVQKNGFRGFFAQDGAPK